MPESKARKVIKYGETAEEPEKKPVKSESFEEPARNEAFEEPAVPDYFVEPKASAEWTGGSAYEKLSQEEIDARLEERRRSRKAKQTRKKRLTILLMVLVFALLATMCGKDIVKLKAENVALKKQQAALKKERDDLKAELESTSEQEYIRDQARKQLRLLNPGELLFVWED